MRTGDRRKSLQQPSSNTATLTDIGSRECHFCVRRRAAGDRKVLADAHQSATRFGNQRTHVRLLDAAECLIDDSVETTGTGEPVVKTLSGQALVKLPERLLIVRGQRTKAER